MTREEMIALLEESSGGHRTKEEIEALLDTSIVDAESLERPDPEEEKFCICGEPLLIHLNGSGEHYDHMTNGY